MAYCNRIIVFSLLFCCSLQLAAQEKDITGLWKGFMYNDTSQLNYRYEIAISEEKGKLYGYSHTYFIIDDKEYHGVKKLKIKRDGNEVITEDVDLIVNNYPVKPPKGIHMQNILKFSMKDTVMILSGLFRTNRTRFYSPNTGYIHVERKKDYSQSALVPHLQELNLAKNLSFLNEENSQSNNASTIAVLKPIPSDEEEKLIVSSAKQLQPLNNIQPATAPAVKTPLPIAIGTKPAEPKTEAPVVAKTVTPKVPEPVVTKPVIIKPAEPAVVKNTALVKKPEVPVTKPAEIVVAKTEAPKQTPTVAEKPVAKTIVSADPSAAKDAGKRKIENIQALYFKSDSLQLTLYDNGEVDGDTVSVIMNGEVIMPRVGLSTNAVKKTIYTQGAGDSIQLVMYAESLGSLPPNTGLLIVYDGGDRYEIRFSGDMQKSSAIVFRRRKD
jgi:hypothetical protein